MELLIIAVTSEIQLAISNVLFDLFISKFCKEIILQLQLLLTQYFFSNLS